MSQEPLLERSFFIPIRRDGNLSDGDHHSVKAWEWLRAELYLQFRGASIAPGYYQGFYEDPDTHEQVADRSRKYVVAAPAAKIDALRVLLSAACHVFKQECICLSVAGEVEFIRGSDYELP